jgi:hypothetical protein
MGKIRLISLCALLALLSACAAPIPIDNLSYKGVSTVKTDKTARIVVTSNGAGSSRSTYLMPVAGTYIAMDVKGKEPFGAKDQQEFLQSLRKELVRLGVVKSATSDENATADMAATIRIDRVHLNGDFQEYKLDITMILNGGNSSFQKQYHITSSEKDSVWEKWNTNGAEAREKLAHLMLERLIPDLETYALAMAHQ